MAEIGERVKALQIAVSDDNLEGTDFIDPNRVFVDRGDHINAIPWDQNYLHEGRKFVVNNFVLAVPATEALETIIEVGSIDNLHVVASANVGGDSIGRLYEGMTFTGGTTAIPNNRNRESTALSSGTITLQPATIDVGAAVLLEEDFLPGGSGGNALGGSGETREEIVLKRDTTYLYQVTNISGQVRTMSLHLEWYTHPPIEGVS